MYKFAIAALLSTTSAVRLHQKARDPLDVVDNSLAQVGGAAEDLFNQIGVSLDGELCSTDYIAYLDDQYSGSVSEDQLNQIYATVRAMFQEEFG